MVFDAHKTALARISHLDLREDQDGWIMLPRGGGGAVRHGCALRLDAVGLRVGW